MTKRLFIAVITMVTLGLGLPALALADNITNSVDATADDAFETLTLTAGGSAGTVTLGVQPTNGDGRNGCNFGGGGSPTLTVSVTSSNPLVATASPSTIVFSGCGSAPTLSISPLTVGSTDITLSQSANTTPGSFNLVTARFTVNVVAPTATPVPPTATSVPPTSVPPTSVPPTAVPPTAVPPTPVPPMPVPSGSGGTGGGGGGYTGPSPAQTPELGSLLLFGSGAVGLGGYALARLRAGRGRNDDE